MKRFAILNLLILGAIWMGVSPSLAGEIDISGYLAAEGRFFTQRPAFENQKREPQFSLVLEPEFRYQTDLRGDQFVLVPFLRLDSVDHERTHFDLREAYWRRTWDSWDLLVGVYKVFWGVTESRHLVDVINQTDGVEDIDDEAKLGQPMVQLGTQRDWGDVAFFMMPYFRERTFPGEKGRLRPSLSVDDEMVQYDSGAEEHHVDFALRTSHFIGDWDVGTHYFYGTGREPVLLPNTQGDRLVPLYEIIHQVGTDIQWTREAWLWKLEGIVREGQGDTFAAFVGGFEYTLFQFLNSPADLGLLLEYNWDGRDTLEAPPTIFDNDLFLGSRLALNDVQDSQGLVGAVVNTDHGSTLFFVEIERRLGEIWKVGLTGRFFLNADDQDPLASIQRDDFINLSIRRYF